jgi:hypothetical protein
MTSQKSSRRNCFNFIEGLRWRKEKSLGQKHYGSQKENYYYGDEKCSNSWKTQQLDRFIQVFKG